MEGPTGKLASSVPICCVKRPNRLWPPNALTGMLLGMVQLSLCRGLDRMGEQEAGRHAVSQC
jgi:hypothetical protein